MFFVGLLKTSVSPSSYETVFKGWSETHLKSRDRIKVRTASLFGILVRGRGERWSV